jgi:hypothetical protein
VFFALLLYDENPMDAHTLHFSVVAWLSKNTLASHVDFRSDFAPPHDPQDDYRVVYEAALTPRRNAAAQIEIWLTDTGYIAVGIESRERLAGRLELRNFRRGFAAGHEPHRVNQEQIETVLGLLADGLFGVRYTKFLGVLISTIAVVPEAHYAVLAATGYPSLRSIWRMSDLQAPRDIRLFRGIAHYEPWKPQVPPSVNSDFHLR